MKYVHVWRGVLDAVNANTRTADDGSTQWPGAYGAFPGDEPGWNNWQDAPFAQVRRSMHQGCLLNPRNLVFYPFFPIFRPCSASGRQESRDHGQKSRNKREKSEKIVENGGN